MVRVSSTTHCLCRCGIVCAKNNPFYFYYFLLLNKLVIIARAGNTTPAITQIIQLYPQLFVERLYPKYIAVIISQYAAEMAVVVDFVSFFTLE